MSTRFLTALPVFNEAHHVNGVLDEVRRFSPNVLVIDDGSTDDTGTLLSQRRDVCVKRHEHNLGYGAALKTAFAYAIRARYEVLVTIDCDGQHQPQRIPHFVAAARDVDIVSGSRYLKRFEDDSEPPADRRDINQEITAELNRRLELELTDAFCGFKAYRVEALRTFDIQENGYAMPLEVWVQAAYAHLKVVEMPVPLIYLEEERSFGGSLDHAETRRRHYLDVLHRSISTAKVKPATVGLSPTACESPEQSGLCGEGVG